MAKHVLLTLAFAAATWAADTCLTAGKNSRTVIPSGTWFAQKYHTASYLPPYFNITSSGAALAPGLIFLSSLPEAPADKAKPALLIVDDTGELVFIDPAVRGYNFHPQNDNGTGVFAYWHGMYSTAPVVGHGFGAITLLDSQYTPIKTLCPNFHLNAIGNQKYKCEFDLHEAQLTDRNSVVGTAYNIRKADLTSINGPKNGYVFSGTVVEVDIATEKVLFRWETYPTIPVTKTKISLAGGRGAKKRPLDYFHINSVQRVGENYLVSSRQTWGIYLISPKGELLWELEGENGGNFGKLPANGTFHWQHHVRSISQSATEMIVTMFNNDNGSPRNTEKPSTGLALRLPLPPGSAPVTAAMRVHHNPPLFVPAEGSYQAIIGNTKNQFMSYGFSPVVAEFGPTGAQLWSATFGNGKADHTYRSFKQTFHSTPKTAPVLVVNKAGLKCKTAYVSWNGATDIDSWAIFSGTSKSKLASVGSAKKAGFETSFGVSGKCIQVAAVSAGKQIRKSNVVCG